MSQKILHPKLAKLFSGICVRYNNYTQCKTLSLPRSRKKRILKKVLKQQDVMLLDNAQIVQALITQTDDIRLRMILTGFFTAYVQDCASHICKANHVSPWNLINFTKCDQYITNMNLCVVNNFTESELPTLHRVIEEIKFILWGELHNTFKVSLAIPVQTEIELGMYNWVTVDDIYHTSKSRITEVKYS